jgi:hypothetical protein
MMDKTHNHALEPALIPACIPLRSEEHSALIIVNPVDLPAFTGKIKTYFGSN